MADAKVGGGVKAEKDGIFAGIPASFRIKKGENEQDAMVRYQQYLADKSGKNRAATFEKKKQEVLSKLPVGEASPLPTASATFIGESDIFGEK